MPDREQILAAIRRTAKANGGKPLGRERFERETGIREADWYTADCQPARWIDRGSPGLRVLALLAGCGTRAPWIIRA